MIRHRLLLLLPCLALLVGCAEVVQTDGSTRLIYPWTVCLAVASPGLAWLGLAGLFLAIGRKARRRAEALAMAEDTGEELTPAPGKALLKGCGLGCAGLAGLILLGPTLPFLVYRVEAHDGGPLLIRELQATHRFTRGEVSDLRVLPPAGPGGSLRLQITAGDKVLYVNAAEVGDESFARIQEALERWYRETPLDPPGPSPMGKPKAPEDEPPPDAAPSQPPLPPPVRAPGPGDGDLSGERLVLSSLWGAGTLQHTAAVRRLAALPDGQALLAADDDGVLRCWTLPDGASRWVVRAHEGAISALALSPDGAAVITSSARAGSTRIHDARSGEALRALPRGGPVTWLPDGLVYVDGWVWDPQQDRCRRPESSEWIADATTTLERKPTATPPAVCALGGGRRAEGDLVTDLATGRPVQTLAGAGDNSVLTVSSDGRWVAGCGESTIEIYQVSAEVPGEGEEPFYEPAYQMFEGRFRALKALAFSPDGGRLVVGDGIDRVVRVFEVETGRLLERWEGHGQAVSAVTFGPKGEHVISASEDGALRVWRVGGEALPQAGGHRGAVTALAFGAASRVVSGGLDGTVRLWDLESGTQEQVLRGHSYSVRALDVAPGGLTAVSGGGDGRLIRWGLKTGRQAAALKEPSLRGLLDLVELEGGEVLVATGDPKPAVWNLDSGRQTTPVTAGFAVTRLAIRADRDRLALAGGDYLQVLRKSGSQWSLLQQHALSKPAALRFVAGQTLLCAADDGVRAFDADGNQTRWIDWAPPPFTCWAFSADGRRAFAGGRRVWVLLDLETGAELERLTPLGDRPTAAAFAASGRRLLVGTARGMILRYEVD